MECIGPMAGTIDGRNHRHPPKEQGYPKQQAAGVPIAKYEEKENQALVKDCSAEGKPEEQFNFTSEGSVNHEIPLWHYQQSAPETLIFVDADGVINVGVRDRPGHTPIQLSEKNLGRC